MSKRLPAISSLFLVLAFALSACGGGGESSEDKIKSTIETSATSTDPAVCKETETLHFMEETTSSSGKQAEKECEEHAESGENNPKSVSVGEVEVEGEKATANAEFEGGSFDGQTLTLALVEEGGKWKVDELTGFVNFDPAPIIKALAEQLEGESSIPARVTSCIVEGVKGLPAAKLEQLVISNESQPIVELAEGCE